MDMNFGGTVFNPVEAPIVSHFLQPSRCLAQCKEQTDSARSGLVVEHTGAAMRFPGIKS